MHPTDALNRFLFAKLSCRLLIIIIILHVAVILTGILAAIGPGTYAVLRAFIQVELGYLRRHLRHLPKLPE